MYNVWQNNAPMLCNVQTKKNNTARRIRKSNGQTHWLVFVIRKAGQVNDSLNINKWKPNILAN